MADRTVMLPGAVRAVPSLAREGYRLGIVSTKYRYRIESILQREGMLTYFSVIIGGEDVQRHKPDPEGVYLALSAMGLPPDAALYVGDSSTDAMTAQSAGLDFAAVMTGVTGREAFPGAIGVFTDLMELAEALK